MRKINPRTLVTLLAACGIFLVGCDANDNFESNSISIAFNGAPVTAGPGFTTSTYSASLVRATYQTLYEYRYLKRPLELIPSLAADWPVISDDGRTVEIRIVDNARFSDDPVFPDGVGRNVIAQDVAYSLLRHFDSSTQARGSSQWRGLIVGIAEWDGDYENPPTGIEVVDDRTIRFRLTTVSPLFLDKLATQSGSIVPREAELAYGRSLGRRSVGSGPYVLDSLTSEKAVLVRNPNYQPRQFELSQVGFVAGVDDPDYLSLDGERLPLTDRIEVKFINSMANRWLAFDKGALDIIPVTDGFLTPRLAIQNPPVLLPSLAKQFRLVTGDRTEVSLMRIRMDDEHLGMHADAKINDRNARLRCAIRRAADPHERNQTLFSGRAVPIKGVIAPSLPEYSTDLYDVPSQSANGSVQLFDDLAAEGPLPEILFGFSTTTENNGNFSLFNTQMTKAGYPGELIKPVTYASFGDFLNGTFKGVHQISTVSWTLNYPDVENNLQLFYGPNRAPGANLGNYENARYDELFLRMSEMRESGERTALVKEMNELLWDDCAFFSSLSPLTAMIVQNRVIGKPERSAAMGGRYFQFLKLKVQTAN